MKYEVGETYNLRWNRPEGYPTVGQTVGYSYNVTFQVVSVAKMESYVKYGTQLFSCELTATCLRCDLDVFSREMIDAGLFVGPIGGAEHDSR